MHQNNILREMLRLWVLSDLTKAGSAFDFCLTFSKDAEHVHGKKEKKKKLDEIAFNIGNIGRFAKKLYWQIMFTFQVVFKNKSTIVPVKC